MERPGTVMPDAKALGTLALCIPAYNAAGFLPRLLAAARDQTVPFDEILVFDDASEDQTAEIAAAWGATVIRSAVNVGCSAGKNRLASISKCEWLHFHDADDSLDSSFVASAKSIIRETQHDVVLLGFRVIDETTGDSLGERVFDQAQLEKDALAYALAEQINPFCGLYRRSTFLDSGGWVEDRRVMQCEDQAGHTSMALHGLRFTSDARILVTNFANPNSMTNSNLPGAQRALVRYFADVSKRVPKDMLPIIGKRLWRIAGTSAAMNDWSNARESVKLAAEIGSPISPEGARWFRMASAISNYGALKLRERIIRAFRPEARVKYRAYWRRQ